MRWQAVMGSLWWACAAPTLDGERAGSSVATVPPTPCTRTAGPALLADPAWGAVPDGGWYGPGVIAGDWTGDGRVDVFGPRLGAPDQLWVAQPGGGWRDEARERLPHDGVQRSLGGATADLDGDGHLDLYLLRLDAPDLWLHNDGTGHFEAETTPLLAGEARLSVTLGDGDGDGDLDAFLASQGLALGRRGDVPPPFAWPEAPGDPGPADPNHLLRWEQGFVDVTAALPDAARDLHSFAATWLDLDGDGVLELHVAADFGPWVHPSVTLRQDGEGGLQPDPDAVGLDLAAFAMSAAFDDLEGDGVPELLVTDIDGVHLLAGRGQAWFEAGPARGLSLPSGYDGPWFTWGAAWGDLDADGRLDAVAASGPLVSEDEQPRTGPTRTLVWRQGEDGGFTEVGTGEGPGAATAGRGVLLLDVDGDGALDLLRAGWTGPPSLLLGRCDAGAWLTVALQGPSPNTHGVGARVEVEAGGQRWVRWVRAGGEAVASGGPPVVQVGLGARASVDALRVVWPDGAVTDAGPLPTRRHLRVRHPDLP